MIRLHNILSNSHCHGVFTLLLHRPAAAWNRACYDLTRENNSYRASESEVGYALYRCGRGAGASRIQPFDGRWTGGCRGVAVGCGRFVGTDLDEGCRCRPGMAAGSRGGRAAASMPSQTQHTTRWPRNPEPSQEKSPNLGKIPSLRGFCKRFMLAIQSTVELCAPLRSGCPNRTFPRMRARG